MATTVQALKDVNGNKLYPKTTADAVAYDSTRTVKGMLSNTVLCEHVKIVEGSDFPINATTLGGHTADYFAKAEDIQSIIGTGAISVIDEGIEDHDDDPTAHAALFNNVGFYVDSNNGSDGNSGLTQDKPFRTIQSAINAIPTSAHGASIAIAPGNYNENIVVRNKNASIIWIGALNNQDGVNINGGIVFDTSNVVGVSKLHFKKAVLDTVVDASDKTYYSLRAYHCNINISSCIFDCNISDSNITIGVDSNDAQILMTDCTFNNYTYAYRCNSGYAKCYNMKGSNDKYAFNCSNGIILYDDCNIQYTVTRLVTYASGLVINKSAAQYLNMFSGTTTENAASFHNSIYRGKDITSYLNDGTLFTRISSGTFDDLYIGDYFTMSIAVEGYTIQCNKYVLCGFDTYMNSGKTSILTKHHAVVMPASILFTATMNDTNTTEGGYYNSKMHQTIMPLIDAGIKTVIGDHLLTYEDILTDQTDSNGKSSHWDHYSIKSRLCSEIDVCGSMIWGNGFDSGMANKQLPIFKLKPEFYYGEILHWMWLVSVYNATDFVGCSMNLGWNNATYSNGGVRPRFLID